MLMEPPFFSLVVPKRLHHDARIPGFFDLVRFQWNSSARLDEALQFDLATTAIGPLR